MSDVHEGRFAGDPGHSGIIMAAAVLCPNGTSTGPCQRCVDTSTLYARQNIDRET